MPEPIPPTITREQVAAALRAKGYDGYQFDLSPDGKDDVYILYREGDPTFEFATKSWCELLQHIGLLPEPGTRNPEPGGSPNAS